MDFGAREYRDFRRRDFNDPRPVRYEQSGLGYIYVFPVPVIRGRANDVRRQKLRAGGGGNTDTREGINRWLLGFPSINNEKLEIEGQRAPRQTLIGFGVDSDNLTAHLPVAEISGARVLFAQFDQLCPSRALEVRLIQKLRRRIELFRASNSTRKLLTGQIDFHLQYSDGAARWVNCPAEVALVDFRTSMGGGVRTYGFGTSLEPALLKEPYLDFRHRYKGGQFTWGDRFWVSAEATPDLADGVSWGVAIFSDYQSVNSPRPTAQIRMGTSGLGGAN